MELKVYTEYSIANDGYSMAVRQSDPRSDKRLFLQSFTFKHVEPAIVANPDEVFCIRDGWNTDDVTVKQFLQAMMDAAWDIGLRPKGIADERNELTAVRYHLEDMRALALKPAE